MSLNGRSLAPLETLPQGQKCHKRLDFDPLFSGIGAIDMNFHIFDRKIPLNTFDEGQN
jgi:hypothetical protein